MKKQEPIITKGPWQRMRRCNECYTIQNKEHEVCSACGGPILIDLVARAVIREIPLRWWEMVLGSLYSDLRLVAWEIRISKDKIEIVDLDK